jgi:hypothetical protein
MRAMLIAAALFCPVLAWADDPQTRAREEGEKTESKVEERQKPENAMLQHQRELLSKMRGFNAYRIELARMAQVNGGTREVVALGEKYVKDYQRLEQDIVDYAKYYGGGLPEVAKYNGTEWTNELASFDSFRTVIGRDFDRAFLTRLSEGNDRMIKLLDEAKRTSADKRFNSLLEKAMRKVRDSQSDYNKIWPDVTT